MKESPREGMPQRSKDETPRWAPGSRGMVWPALLKATQWSNKMNVENDYCIDQHILNKKHFLEVIGIVALLQLIKG